MTKSDSNLIVSFTRFEFVILSLRHVVFGAHITVHGSSVWNEMYQSALELSEPFDIVENMPRRCGRQTTRANHPANTPKQYWKVSL